VRIRRKIYHYHLQLYLKVQRYLFGVDLPAVVMNKEIKKTLASAKNGRAKRFGAVPKRHGGRFGCLQFGGGLNRHRVLLGNYSKQIFWACVCWALDAINVTVRRLDSVNWHGLLRA
jgi:hypothetical protein